MFPNQRNALNIPWINTLFHENKDITKQQLGKVHTAVEKYSFMKTDDTIPRIISIAVLLNSIQAFVFFCVSA